jgi:hypothetical protein
MTDRRLHSVPSTVADDLAAQDVALDVECPLCGADRDAYCTNPLTDGQHLRGRISHWQRLAATTTRDET